MEDLTGKQLGPYQVVAPLGEGGMAAVYKAFQPGVERYVALKILPRHYASDPEFVGRFQQEAKILAHLQHPHILPVFDYGQADGYTYIVMPFLQNGDLTDLLKGQPLTLPQVRRIIAQIGDALDYAHQQGLVHRDVKPNNVLLDERGNCLLSDFGITKIVEGTAKFTVTGGIIGTPDYMSPEQGMGRKLDGRSDIYALGVMLFQMVTGRVPYKADTPMAVLFKHVTDPLPLPRQLNPDIPEAVEQVILKALAKRPEDRFATAGAMVEALRGVIPETATQGTPVVDPGPTLKSTPQPASPPAEPTIADLPADRPAAKAGLLWILAGVVAVAVIGLVGVVAIFLLSRGGPEPSVANVVAVTATEQTRISTAAPIRVMTATPVPPTSTPAPATPLADTIIVPPTATAAPTLTPTPSPSAPLSDEFTGAGLDDQKWVVIQGAGQVEVADGVARLTSAGQTFPLVYARTNPFPAEGNFTVKVRLRYVSVAERGVGFRLGTTLADYGANQDLARAELFQGRLIEIWQDAVNWHVAVGEQNTPVHVLPAPDLDWHQVDVNYIEGVYQIRLDGAEVYRSNPLAQRPAVLWFGNPAQVDSAGPWSSLELESVTVEPLMGTITLAPTATSTTVLLGQNCTPPVGTFASAWQNYRTVLGCPLSGVQPIPTIAEESFQGGHLFWRSDTDAVYVINDRNRGSGADLFEGLWQTNPTWKWDGSNPDGVGLTPPSGLVEPRRGFGWLWRTHLGGAEGTLGWALDKEYGFDNTGQAQTFEQGTMFKGSGPKTYVLLSSGTFYVQ